MVRFHLLGQMVLSIAVFSNNKEAGGVHVQPVDKTYLVAFSIIQHFFHDAVGYGVAGLTLCRMNNNSGLLVYYKKVFVLVNHRNRDILGREVTFFFRYNYSDNVTWLWQYPAGHAFPV